MIERECHCIRCEQFKAHIAKANGGSWHYYCIECDLQLFYIDKPWRKQNKNMQYQIKSWVDFN